MDMSEEIMLGLAEARQSAIHGRGVFALRDIEPGELIGVYQGTRLPPGAEPMERVDGITYLFSLSDGSTIDGGQGGNQTRLINHSCEPNCEAYEQQSASGELEIAIYASQPIASEQELFIDYNLDAPGKRASDFACRCGAARCRGTMLARRKAKRRARKERGNESGMPQAASPIAAPEPEARLADLDF